MSDNISVIVQPQVVAVSLSTGVTAQVTTIGAVRVAASISGVQGPAGSQGNPGPPGASAAQVVAAELLGAHRVVTAAGLLAAPGDADIVAGITTGAVAAGQTAVLTVSGPLSDAGWNWTPGAALYIGTLGVLTATPPSPGKVRIVARAVTATSILVDLQPTILTI